MQIKFRTSDKGFGLFLYLNIEILSENEFCSEEIDTNINFAFDDSIALGFKQGFFFLKKAIRDNIVQIKNYIKSPITIKLVSVDSNPAHYQHEAFYGATILLLNQIFNINLQEPKYTYESKSKKFEVR